MYNVDLIRELLIKIKSHGMSRSEVSVDGHNQTEIQKHLDLTQQKGLVNIPPIPVGGAAKLSLTRQGQDFLDDARESVIWEKAKAAAMNTLEGVTLESVRKALARLVGRPLLPESKAD